MCFKTLVCVTISNIFRNDFKSDTGLQSVKSHLLPFLCSGFITAYFNLSGNTPQEHFITYVIQWRTYERTAYFQDLCEYLLVPI